MWFSLLRTSIPLGCELWILHTYSFSHCRTAYTMCCRFLLLCLLIIITFCWIFTAVSLPVIITTKSYFYLEKRADSYFKCVVKQQLLSIRIHLHPFFSSIHSLEISFQNLSLSVWNEATRLVPRALAWGCSRWAESESGTSLVQPCGKSFLSDTGAHWLQNQEP